MGEVTLPRFEDGSVNLQELFRQLAEEVTDEIMDAEAEQLCRATGTSTRKVARIMSKVGVDHVSRDQAGSMARTIDAEVSELMARPVDGLRTPHVWLDATYARCRRGGRVASTAAVTAIGCDEDGHRVVLGKGVVDTESYDYWLGFLRGVRGVQLVISDAHQGLRRAISETFQGAAWQRCVVHLMRDCTREAGNRKVRGKVARILSTVFDADDPAMVRATCHRARDMLGDVCPRAAAVLEDAEPDALAYLDFPVSHWGKLKNEQRQPIILIGRVAMPPAPARLAWRRGAR